MAEDPELTRLVDGCLRGDRRSQQAVHRRFYGKMKGVCMRYTKDADQAQDVLQEGFIKVFNNLERYKGAGSFEGWIRRIMVNLSIDYFRKSRHDFVLLTQDHQMESFEEELEDEEDRPIEHNFGASQIIEAMQKLTPAYRMVFNMYVFENYQHKEIAEILRISVGTSKSNLAKAKRNLRKILIRDFTKPDEQNVNTI
ncbi:MAG: sigma-70 family RNA polymerase sigma factor [Flavobacteriales bacterium]|nr:sigma-70 family RNA polymerase sigma factor [Flavobacteriales bacterium]